MPTHPDLPGTSKLPARATLHRVTLGALAALSVLTGCDVKQPKPPRQKADAFWGYAPDAAAPRLDAATVDVGAGTDGETAVDAGPTPDEGPPRDAATFAQIPFAVETRVGDRNTRAGLENRLSCEVLDQQGAPIPDQETRVEIHPDNGFERTEAGAIGHVARDYQIVCTAPGLGLRDPTPAEWTVRGAAASLVVATLVPDAAGQLSDTEIPAGGRVSVGCETFDAYGNPVDGMDGELRVTPPLPGFDTRPGEAIVFPQAGTFDVNCAAPGAESGPGLTIVVDPGLPAHLAVRVFPDRGVFRVGSVVELLSQVTDELGNPLSGVPVEVTSAPPLPPFGAARFQATPEGRYTLTATVTGPTLHDRVLTAGTEILVDYGGPGIRCGEPAPGDVVEMPANGLIHFSGAVADISGLQGVTVDGVPVPLAADGSFHTELPVTWGLNAHDVVAIDENGNENSGLCAFFASDRFHNEAAPLPDALVLRLGQGAIDEGEPADPNGPLASVADILRRIVNSRGLRDTVNEAALAQNPIVPNECRASVLGLCLFSLGVDYTDLQIGGRNTLALTLVDGGLNAQVTIRNLAISAQLHGTLGNSATISTDHISVDLTFDVRLGFNGQPQVTLRGVNNVDVGHLDSDFSGFITGAILDLVFSAFEGLIRRTVTDAIRNFLQDNLSSALHDLFANLDIGALSQGFDVPLPAGGESIRLVLTPTLSTLDFAVGRALFGVGTKVDGPDRVAGRSPGVPLPPGPALPTLDENRTVGGGVRLALLNQLMHRLWRAGYFDAAAGGLVGGVAADLPAGSEVFLSLPTAPAVIGVGRDDGADVRVFIGPTTAGVVAPGIFAEPFRVELAAAVEAGVHVTGDRDLSFEDVHVSAIHLGLGGAQMPDRSRRVLEDTLTRVLQGLIDHALNDGLPSLPLPDFVIPASLGRYDLPVGQGLGLRAPVLTSDTAFWSLAGDFRQ